MNDDDIRAAVIAVGDRMQAHRWVQYYAARDAWRTVLELQERHPRSAELRLATNALRDVADEVLERIHANARRAREAA